MLISFRHQNTITHICIYVLLAAKLHNVISECEGYRLRDYIMSVNIISTTNTKTRSDGQALITGRPIVNYRRWWNFCQ